MEAFVYRWRNRADRTWYIGYHKGRADDGYVCSSRTARPAIQTNPADWERKILRWGTQSEMAALERRLLTRLDARRNPHSWNQTNGGAPVGRPRPFGLTVVGAHAPTARVRPEWDQACRRMTGRFFEIHYLEHFFQAIREQHRGQVRDMMPNIKRLFGIELEMYNV